VQLPSKNIGAGLSAEQLAWDIAARMHRSKTEAGRIAQVLTSRIQQARLSPEVVAQAFTLKTPDPYHGGEAYVIPNYMSGMILNCMPPDILALVLQYLPEANLHYITSRIDLNLLKEAILFLPREQEAEAIRILTIALSQTLARQVRLCKSLDGLLRELMQSWPDLISLSVYRPGGEPGKRGGKWQRRIVNPWKEIDGVARRGIGTKLGFISRLVLIITASVATVPHMISAILSNLGITPLIEYIVVFSSLAIILPIISASIYIYYDIDDDSKKQMKISLSIAAIFAIIADFILPFEIKIKLIIGLLVFTGGSIITFIKLSSKFIFSLITSFLVSIFVASFFINYSLEGVIIAFLSTSILGTVLLSWFISMLLRYLDTLDQYGYSPMDQQRALNLVRSSLNILNWASITYLIFLGLRYLWLLNNLEAMILTLFIEIALGLTYYILGKLLKSKRESDNDNPFNYPLPVPEEAQREADGKGNLPKTMTDGGKPYKKVKQIEEQKIRKAIEKVLIKEKDGRFLRAEARKAIDIIMKIRRSAEEKLSSEDFNKFNYSCFADDFLYKVVRRALEIVEYQEKTVKPDVLVEQAFGTPYHKLAELNTDELIAGAFLHRINTEFSKQNLIKILERAGFKEASVENIYNIILSHADEYLTTLKMWRLPTSFEEEIVRDAVAIEELRLPQKLIEAAERASVEFFNPKLSFDWRKNVLQGRIRLKPVKDKEFSRDEADGLMFIFYTLLKRIHPHYYYTQGGRSLIQELDIGKISVNVEEKTKSCIRDKYALDPDTANQIIETWDYMLFAQHLGQILLPLGYPERELPCFLKEFKVLLSEINEELKSKDTEQLETTLLKLSSLLKEKGYIDTYQPKPLIKLLIATLNTEDIFELISRAEVSRKAKEKLKETIVSCSAISQLTYILLKLLGIGAKGAIAPDHAFIVIPVKNQVLFVDFTLEVVRKIDFLNCYQKEGKCLVLKQKQRIDHQSLQILRRQFGQGVLGLEIPLTEKELLNLFYPYIQIVDGYALTPCIFYNFGVIYTKLGKHSQAINEFNKAIRLNPNYAEAHSSLGFTYAAMGRHNQAVNEFNIAIGINPNNAKAHANLGISYAKLGRHAEAIKEFNIAIRLNPNDAKAYSNLGIAYAKLGRHSQAIKEFNQAIRVNPNYAEAFFNLGTSHFKLGNHLKAIVAYKEAIRLKSEYTEAYFNLGALYFISSKRPEAIENLAIAVFLNSKISDLVPEELRDEVGNYSARLKKGKTGTDGGKRFAESLENTTRPYLFLSLDQLPKDLEWIYGNHRSEYNVMAFDDYIIGEYHKLEEIYKYYDFPTVLKALNNYPDLDSKGFQEKVEVVFDVLRQHFSKFGDYYKFCGPISLFTKTLLVKLGYPAETKGRLFEPHFRQKLKDTNILIEKHFFNIIKDEQGRLWLLDLTFEQFRDIVSYVPATEGKDLTLSSVSKRPIPTKTMLDGGNKDREQVIGSGLITIDVSTGRPILEQALKKIGVSSTYIQILLNVAVMHGLASGKATIENKGSNFDMQITLARHPEIAMVLINYINAKLHLAANMPSSIRYIEIKEKVDAQRNLALATIIANGGEDRLILKEYLSICDAIVTSNFLSCRYEGTCPPALVFDGAKLPKGKYKHGLYRAVIVPDASGSLSILIKTDEVSAGGIRVEILGEKNKLDLNAIFEEDSALADGMASKDIWAGIPYLGSKILTVLTEGADIDKVLAKMARAMVNIVGDEGVWPKNIAGPDMNSAGHIQPAVDAIRDEYRKHLRRELRLIVEALGKDARKILKEIADLGRDSRQKILALYDLNDPAMKGYIGLLMNLEKQSGKYFLRDPFSWAMREAVIDAIRDRRISASNGWRLDNDTQIVLDKIIGVAIGGGSLAECSLVADPSLKSITALGCAQSLIHTIRYLLEKDRIKKGQKVKLAIIGAGQVGGGMMDLIGYINEQLEDKTEVILVAVAEQGRENSGIVYKPEGFSEEELSLLKKVRESNSDSVSNGYVLKVMQARPEVKIFPAKQNEDPRDILINYDVIKADILFPAAKGPTITKKNINKYVAKFPLAIIAGENCCFGEDSQTIAEIQQILHNRGVLALDGCVSNFGTAYIVCSMEGDLKHKYSVGELKKIWAGVKEQARKDILEKEDELIPSLLKKLDNEPSIPPGELQARTVTELKTVTYRLLKLYEERDSVTVKDIDELIISSLRDPQDGAPKSYMPLPVAKVWAATQLAREETFNLQEAKSDVRPPYPNTEDMGNQIESEKASSTKSMPDGGRYTEEIIDRLNDNVHPNLSLEGNIERLKERIKIIKSVKTSTKESKRALKKLEKLLDIQRLIRRVTGTPANIIYDSLVDFSLKQTKVKRTYFKSRSQLYWVAYALEEDLDLRNVPKTYRQGAILVRWAIEKGMINKEEAKKAVTIFMDTSSDAFGERSDRQRKSPDHRERQLIEKYRKEYNEFINKIFELRKKTLPVSVVRIFAHIQKFIGRTIHCEIDNLIDAWVSQEIKEVEELERKIVKLWKLNVLWIKAIYCYERIRAEVLLLSDRFRKEDLSEADKEFLHKLGIRDIRSGKSVILEGREKQYFESLKKTAQRWNRLGGKFRKLPYNFENAVVEALKQTPQINFRFIEEIDVEKASLEQGVIKIGSLIFTARRAYTIYLENKENSNTHMPDGGREINSNVKVVKEAIKLQLAHIEDEVIPKIEEDVLYNLVRQLEEVKKNKKRVYICAAGRSLEVANYFVAFLNQWGIHRITIVTPGGTIPFAKKGDLFIFVSGSGKTVSVIHNVEVANELRGINKITITAKPSSDTWQGFKKNEIIEISGRTKVDIFKEEEKLESWQAAQLKRIEALAPMGTEFELSTMLFFKALVESLDGILAFPAPQEVQNVVKNNLEKLIERLRKALLDELPSGEIDILINKLLEIYLKSKKSDVSDRRGVFILGAERSNAVVEMFAHRLQNLGIVVHNKFLRSPKCKDGDILFVVSGTGQTKEVLGKLLEARNEGAYVILLTGLAQSEIAKQADLVISIRSKIYPLIVNHLQTRQLSGRFKLPEALMTDFGVIAAVYLDAVIGGLIDNIGIDKVKEMQRRHFQDMAEEMAKFEETLVEEKEPIVIMSGKKLQKYNNIIKENIFEISESSKDLLEKLDKGQIFNFFKILKGAIINKSKIYLIAEDRSLEIAEYMGMRLPDAGIDEVIRVEPIRTIPPIEEDDIVIIISETGKEVEIKDNLIALKDLKDMNTHIIVITHTPESESWEDMDIELKAVIPKDIENSNFDLNTMLYLEGIIEALINLNIGVDSKAVFEITCNAMRKIIKDNDKFIKKEAFPDAQTKTLMKRLFRLKMLNRRVFVVGADTRNKIAELFAWSLQELGFVVYNIGPDKRVPAFEPGDILIAISGSGNTLEVYDALKAAKDRGNYIILLTATSESIMADLANLVLILPGKIKYYAPTRIQEFNLKGKEEPTLPTEDSFGFITVVYLEGLAKAIEATLRNHFKKKEPPSFKVLDIGTFDGTFAANYRKAYPRHLFVGIEKGRLTHRKWYFLLMRLRYIKRPTGY